jgi:hypothetical protein
MKVRYKAVLALVTSLTLGTVAVQSRPGKALIR